MGEFHALAPDALYRKKFEIGAEDKVATAGSCFAQHIANAMRRSRFNVLDVESAPAGLPRELYLKYGYGQYSARYSNIYTARQLLQVLREAFEGVRSPEPVWERAGRYFDSMRPAVEPDGQSSPEEVLAHRDYHLSRVRALFEQMDVFIFTLGLTESWVLSADGWVFPTAPGTIAGRYESERYGFKNFSYIEVIEDMRLVLGLLRAVNKSPNLRILLTVSPVPLTATFSGEHILTATTYSKSVLRAVVGALSEEREDVAYFPSYEMVTSTLARGVFFDSNMRTVNSAGVDVVMRAFLRSHQKPVDLKPLPGSSQLSSLAFDEVGCEEALLDAFASRSTDS